MRQKQLAAATLTEAAAVVRLEQQAATADEMVVLTEDSGRASVEG